jgi:ASC-1-like (ASCH) protein
MIELGFEDNFFQDIKNGKKTTIGKIDADLQGIKKGDVVIFKDVSKKNNSSEKISVKVKDIIKFSDVPTMLKEMKLKTILPRSRTYKDGEKVFEETYGNRLKGAKFTAFTFDILENTIKVPKGTVLRVTTNSKSKEPVINFQPEDEAELHMQERHERFNKNALGPRIKNKKNDKNYDLENDDNDENNEVDSNVFGPRIKNKKNGEMSGLESKTKRMVKCLVLESKTKRMVKCMVLESKTKRMAKYLVLESKTKRMARMAKIIILIIIPIAPLVSLNLQ